MEGTKGALIFCKCQRQIRHKTLQLTSRSQQHCFVSESVIPASKDSSPQRQGRLLVKRRLIKVLQRSLFEIKRLSDYLR